MTAPSLTEARPISVTAERTSEGLVIAFDTRHADARRALDLTMMRLGPEGRELAQAEAGVRMAFSQRRRARLGYGSRVAARTVLRGAIKRLRRARAAFAPVTIPVLEPVTASVRKLDPAMWGSDVLSSLRVGE